LPGALFGITLTSMEILRSTLAVVVATVIGSCDPGVTSQDLSPDANSDRTMAHSSLDPARTLVGHWEDDQGTTAEFFEDGRMRLTHPTDKIMGKNTV